MAVGLILDSNQYFVNVVDEAFEERRIKTYPQIKTYVVDVLKHYLAIENLYDEQGPTGKKTRKTLAEMFLTASQADIQLRCEKMKRLGDSSLYISGFFSDSFQRKIIDVDYYMDVGQMAYDSLSQDVRQDTFAKLYKQISHQFRDLVDVLALISQKAKITDEENILRMMDLYTKTGSPLIQETLAEKGVFNKPSKVQHKQ